MTTNPHIVTVKGAWSDGTTHHGNADLRLVHDPADPFTVRIDICGTEHRLLLDIDQLDAGSQSYTAHGSGQVGVWATALRVHIQGRHVLVTLPKRITRLFVGNVRGEIDGAIDEWLSAVTR